MSNPDESALAFAGPIVTAQMAWSALQGHGIEAVLLNQNTGTMLQPDHVQVLVPKSELLKALEILVEMGLATASTRDED
jgi:type III secretory pathway lipoprotein EscJ